MCVSEPKLDLMQHYFQQLSPTSKQQIIYKSIFLTYTLCILGDVSTGRLFKSISNLLRLDLNDYGRILWRSWPERLLLNFGFLHYIQKFCKKITSVSDPSHFDVDPDPGIHIWEKWIRILGSTFGKSGSGSGSKVDPDPDPSTYFSYFS